MGYVKAIYQPFKVVGDEEYFSVGTVAEIVGKSRQMVQLWDSWSDELANRGEARLIPKSSRIGKGRVRCWTSSEIDTIVEFSKHIKYGQMAEFSRTRWGVRADSMSQDRSLKAQENRKIYRKTVNKTGKKLQRDIRLKEFKEAKREMYKFVQRHAKNTRI